jgi:hypothetical protein
LGDIGIVDFPSSCHPILRLEQGVTIGFMDVNSKFSIALPVAKGLLGSTDPIKVR